MASQYVIRKRLRARRAQDKRRGVPIWVIALLVVGFVASASLAAGAGTVFAVYQHYAQDYIRIEDLLIDRQVGLTRVFDRKGDVELGVLPNPTARLLHPVELQDISQSMIDATVSTEDNSFWTHPGVNYRGLARAAWENYVGGSIGSGTGGSSITQQLIKNIYICGSFTDPDNPCVAERTVDRKLREIAYAIELERDYSKEQILTWYLNHISYADRYVGVQAAAEGYFRVNAADLTLAQSAMLAGIPAFPTLYHPRLNCLRNNDGDCILDERGRMTVGGDAKARQETVIDLMVTHGWISALEGENAKAETLFVYPAATTAAQDASAFIDNQVAPRLVRMCEAGLLPKLENVSDCLTSVQSAGWTVRTTLDWDATQDALELARTAIERGLEAGCECHNAAIVTIDPESGELVVYAPNRDPSFTADPRVAGNVDQLVEINQPGSAFKPAVYLAWFEYAEKAPMSALWDTHPLILEDTDVEIRNPRQAPHSEGLISARAALGGSQNVGAYRAAQEAGIENVITMAKLLGITTLEQQFDPTFVSHLDIIYGASVATGGANIRAVDMAYMNATIANMGVMVGVPHYATTVEADTLNNTAFDEGIDYENALQQKLDFQRGHLRLPGTRALDPVVILEVRDIDDRVIFLHEEVQRIRTVDASSVWLLHSIMSDCEARFVIWSCGQSNEDLGLDAFVNGVKLPGGIKTGTQQGPLDAADTLETWMNGYSRHAATAVWVGNATNELVIDGASGEYASARTTLWLYKNWMDSYHGYLLEEDRIDAIEGFAELQPENVEFTDFPTPATDRNLAGGCEQEVESWIRTDVEYESQCEPAIVDTRNGLLASSRTPQRYREMQSFVKLPEWEAEHALTLVFEPPEELDVLIAIKPEQASAGEVAVSISWPTRGSSVGRGTEVVGSVNVGQLTAWQLEIAPGANPAAEDWILLAEGEENVSNERLGRILLEEFAPRVYTLRLTARQGLLEPRRATIQMNVSDQLPPLRAPGALTPVPAQPLIPVPGEPTEPEPDPAPEPEAEPAE